MICVAEAKTTADQLLSAWTKDGYDVVLRQSRLQPDGVAVRNLLTGEALSFAELDRLIARCTSWLSQHVARGARVALLARNSFQHMILFYACARAGTIFVPLNWRLTGHELTVLIADCSPEYLIFQPEFAESAQLAAGTSTICKAMASVDFEAAMAKLAPSPLRVSDPAATSLLLYTSGTTGLPKAVTLCPRNCFYESANFIQVGNVTDSSVFLLNVPLFHTVGLMAIMNSAFAAGGRVVMTDRFVPAEALAQMSDPALAITHYFCVPQIVQALVSDPEYAESDLTRLTGLFTGGAPMPPILTQKLIDDGIMAVNGYGLSESGTAIHMPLDKSMALRKLGSSGIPAPLIDVRLVSRDGRDVAQGEVGEIWLKGPGVTEGYWKQPEVNAQYVTDGWLHTGDAARMDTDGYYYVVDRWKDLYISGGENVYPAEVEAVLREMSGVVDAGVIGVADAKWGESGCAYLVLRPGLSISDADIIAHCGPRLARYKHPAHIKFVDAIPRNASGKILKDTLRQHFVAEQEHS